MDDVSAGVAVRIRRPVTGEPVVVRLSPSHAIPGLVVRHEGGGKVIAVGIGYTFGRVVLEHESTGRYPQWGYPASDPFDLVEVGQ